jgi:hypothetical protein
MDVSEMQGRAQGRARLELIAHLAEFQAHISAGRNGQRDPRPQGWGELQVSTTSVQ